MIPDMSEQLPSGAKERSFAMPVGLLLAALLLFAIAAAVLFSGSFDAVDGIAPDPQTEAMRPWLAAVFAAFGVGVGWLGMRSLTKAPATR